MVLAATASDIAWIALAVFLVAVGLGLGWAFFQLAATLSRLSAFIRGTERELLPVIANLEDLQIALDGILDRVPVDGDVTVAMSTGDGVLYARVGPVDVKDELDAADSGELNLRRVLAAVVDDVQVDGEWIRLTKRVG